MNITIKLSTEKIEDGIVLGKGEQKDVIPGISVQQNVKGVMWAIRTDTDEPEPIPDTSNIATDTTSGAMYMTTTAFTEPKKQPKPKKQKKAKK